MNTCNRCGADTYDDLRSHLARHSLCVDCFKKEYPGLCPTCGGIGRIDISINYDRGEKARMVNCHSCSGSGRAS